MEGTCTPDRTHRGRLVGRSATRWYSITKRWMDLVICILLLPLVIPVMLVVAAAIWIDDGRPVLFSHWRTGKAGRRFRLWKFRTMVTNAEELKKRYAHLNELKPPDFKIKNDPRITRVGRFLRKSSLDELPQIFNVLWGQMSLVGPRPTSFGARTYDLWHTERLEVLPGITGLWQITARSDVDFNERLRLDIMYLERRCLWYDLKLLAMTPFAVFLRKGAY